MTLFALNESHHSNVAGDVTVFRTLDHVLAYMEPMNVESDDFTIFDSDGQFYKISFKIEGPWYSRRAICDHHIAFVDRRAAERVVADHLALCGLPVREGESLEASMERMGVHDFQIRSPRS